MRISDWSSDVCSSDLVAGLAGSVYHDKLGSQLERVERVRRVAGYVAEQLGANVQHADRAALLAKADLGCHMVAEFPELPEFLGAYYAAASSTPAGVGLARTTQYPNRLDRQPTTVPTRYRLPFPPE